MPERATGRPLRSHADQAGRQGQHRALSGRRRPPGHLDHPALDHDIRRRPRGDDIGASSWEAGSLDRCGSRRDGHGRSASVRGGGGRDGRHDLHTGAGSHDVRRNTRRRGMGLAPPSAGWPLTRREALPDGSATRDPRGTARTNDGVMMHLDPSLACVSARSRTSGRVGRLVCLVTRLRRYREPLLGGGASLAGWHGDSRASPIGR